MTKKLIYLIFLFFFISLITTDQGIARKQKSNIIESVTFKNNKIYSDNRLYKLMVCRPSTLFSKNKYNPDIFQEDLKNIILFYKQNGYLKASIIDYNIQIDSSSNKVHIIITLKEGELTRIEEIGFLGNQLFTDEKLLKIIKLSPGNPFARKKIETAVLNLLRLYADNGYLESDVTPGVMTDTTRNRAILDFYIKEGLQYNLGKIFIHGLEKTKPNVIHRELQFSPGEIMNYSRILKSQQRLYLTGLFQSVFIYPISNGDSGKKDITIEVKENPSVEINTSIGYGSVDKLRGKIEIYNQNVGGKARKVGMTLRLSSIQRGLKFLFTEPWTFSTPWRTDLALGTEHKEEPGYHLNQYGGHLTMGRVFNQHLTIRARLRIQPGELSKVKVKQIPKEIKTDIRSLQISLINDTRDNQFNTKQGIYTELSSEIGGSFSQQIHRFFRLQGTFKYFYFNGSQTVCATGMEIGIMKAEGGLSNIPLSERFYAGGPNSVRGFKYQKLGPLEDDQTPLGGQLKCIWHVIEIRHKLYKIFKGTIFLDMGNVWSSPKDFQFNEFRFSPGLGLRLDTPIGVGRIDLGFNLNPKPNESQCVWSFSMGQVF